MKFVKADQLKVGMRIARPIYNKKGVLLYERDSKITTQGIESVKNFGLIGIFILEPAEPCPPMSAEDIEFERFQTMQVFAIEEELREMNMNKHTKKLDMIVAAIIKEYGRLNHKINFIQNLRSNEDYVYKHSLNVAILCALMGHRLNISVAELNDVVTAGVVHDIGKLNVSESALKGASEREREFAIKNAELNGLAQLEYIFTSNPNVKRMSAQANKVLDGTSNPEETSKMKIVIGAQILMVAETYDTMTAMNALGEPASEVEALRYMLKNPDIYSKQVVSALVSSITFLSSGTGVELTNGERALVIAENTNDVLRPTVLQFSNNEIIDLSNRMVYDDLEIADIMKTMDNRHVIDDDSLKKLGLKK